jgi:protein involved in polysaccharide export with SLBB domain
MNHSDPQRLSLTSTRRRAVAAALLLLVAVRLDAMSQSVAPSAAAPVFDEYRIQIGDQLDIKFFYNPTLNEQVTVRPDGRFSLQLIQEVVAAGLTPAALTRELTDRYALNLKQPEVTVIVRSFGSAGLCRR